MQAAYEIITRGTYRKELKDPNLSVDDDPFFSILAAYLRRRQAGNQ